MIRATLNGNAYLHIAQEVARKRFRGAIYDLPVPHFWNLIETFDPPKLLSEIRIEEQLMMLCFMAAMYP